MNVKIIILLLLITGCKCKQEAKPVDNTKELEAIQQRLETISEEQAEKIKALEAKDSVLTLQYEQVKKSNAQLLQEAKNNRNEKVIRITHSDNDSLRRLLAN